MEESIWNIFEENETKQIEKSVCERVCPECDSAHFVIEEGHSICTKCGTVIETILEGDDGSMYHDSSKSGNTHRLSTGANALLQKSSLGTSIGPGSHRF